MTDRRSQDGVRSEPVDCASTRAAIQRFVRDRGRFRDPATREHLEACASCRAAYRAHVEGLAEIARARRAGGRRAASPSDRAADAGAHSCVERGAGTRPDRAQATGTARLGEAEGVRAAAQDLERASDPKRRKRRSARLLLAPAALALGFLVVQRMTREDGASAHGFEAMPIVTPVEGSVQVSERRLAADESALLARGATCRTWPSSRARIAAGGAELELGPETWLQVEAKAPPRFRLALGELTASGPCTITTAHGVAEIGEGARLSIRLGWNGIAFEDGAGDARWFDAEGERALGDGVPLELARVLTGADARDALR